MMVVKYSDLKLLLSAAVKLGAKVKTLELAIGMMEKFDVQDPILRVEKL